MIVAMSGEYVDLGCLSMAEVSVLKIWNQPKTYDLYTRYNICRRLIHDKKSKLVFSSIFHPCPKGGNRGKLGSL